MLIAQLPLLLSFLSLVSAVAGAAEFDPDLAGTWSTKSRKVVTGPDFYDPINDRLKEPYTTGISYSFTEDGHFEEAYYRAVPNPTRPSCPGAMMQWQHGKYSIESNGSLVLTPFADDGRQLISDPCKSLKASYYRYNQTEVFKRYEVRIDPFHKVKRLNLYEHDGSPMNPMFLMYEPPQMLPTRTLNPVETSPDGNSKRDELSAMNLVTPLNKDAIVNRKKENRNSERWWWLGVAMTSVGGIALLFP